MCQLEIPPPSATRPSETTTKTNMLRGLVKIRLQRSISQSFTVDETGAFLTSFDVFFGIQDPLYLLN